MFFIRDRIREMASASSLASTVMGLLGVFSVNLNCGMVLDSRARWFSLGVYYILGPIRLPLPARVRASPFSA